jgi:hypothetical protein
MITLHKTQDAGFIKILKKLILKKYPQLSSLQIVLNDKDEYELNIDSLSMGERQGIDGYIAGFIDGYRNYNPANVTYR